MKEGKNADYNYSHGTRVLEEWTKCNMLMVHKAGSGSNDGLFHLIRVPTMDDFSVSVPGGIDMLGYLRILL